MKKLVTVSALIFLFVIAAKAQETSQMVVYLGGGVSPLSGDFQSAYHMGYHGLCGLGTKATSNIDFLVKLEYHSFSLDMQGQPLLGGTLSSFMMGGDIRYAGGPSHSVVRPMVLGGLGVAKVAVSDLTDGYNTVSFENETKLYLEAGGGIVLRLGKFASIFVIARYVSVFVTDSKLDFTPITIGVTI